MEFTLDKILELIAHPEDVLAVESQEAVIDWTTFFIYQLEEEIADMDFIVDQQLEKLVEAEGSVAAAEVKIRLTPEYRQRKEKNRTLKALKSYRQNIRRKRDRIIPR